MVLAGDVATPGHEVLHRLIDAAVAVLQLVGIAARGQGEDLMAQANAEDRLAHIAHQPSGLLDERRQVLRIAGPVAQHDAIGLSR